MLGRAQHFDPLVKNHQHFICEKCGQVYDVLVDTENEIKPARLPHWGFKVTSHQTPSMAPASIALGKQKNCLQSLKVRDIA